MRFLHIPTAIVLIGVLATQASISSARYYHPSMGQFLGRDSLGYSDGHNVYQYVRSSPALNTDPYGTVTLEQLNEMAGQMGTPLIKEDLSNATEAIVAIQKVLQVPEPNGDFGSVSVEAYERWAKATGKPPVKLRDSRSSKEVLGWIIKYWPTTHKCAKDCPIQYGEFLAIIFFESRDSSTRTKGSRFTYFNAIGGPFGYKNYRTTAVGLAQFTRDTASRQVAYDGEKSIEAALKLMMDDALNKDGTCEFNKAHRSLNRWEAWIQFHNDILAMGKKINDLAKQRKGAENITDPELNAILGIP
jgi:hypothetical protein